LEALQNVVTPHISDNLGRHIGTRSLTRYNVPVSIGGMIINPGDIIVGDEDGLVALSPEHAEHAEHAEQVLFKAREHDAHEQQVIAEIATGAIDQSWLDKVLEKAGLAN
jgi:regulator of RNase E activity RraA